MDNQNCKQFTEVILKATNLNNIEEALFLLVRKEYIKYNKIPQKVYVQVADMLLHALQEIDFDKNIYNRHNVSMYLQKYFKDWDRLECFLKPIIEEISIIKRERMKKYKKYILDRYTLKQIEIIFINRVLKRINYEWYQYYLEEFQVAHLNIHKEECVNLIKEYFEKFDISIGSVRERPDRYIDLLNRKFDYKLKEVVIGLQKKYDKEYIMNYLGVRNTIYKNVLRKIENGELDYIALNNKNEKENVINITIKEPTIEDLNEFKDIDINYYNNISVAEGRRKLYIHNKIERNSKVSKLAKEFFKKTHGGRLFCECCGFDFEEKYGEMGENHIVAHHENPLGENCGEVQTKIKDFKMVCSNCHDMLHKSVPCLTVEELRERITKQKIIRRYKRGLGN